MKAKTKELLYDLLWTCDMLMRPTFRNLTDSFEGWAYRNGLMRQLDRLERQKFLETAPASPRRESSPFTVRLTEAGRLYALGGRDPEACWARAWDGFWCGIMYDFPAADGTRRNQVRNFLRACGFGWLQKSFWISPFPLKDFWPPKDGRMDVESFICVEIRPCTSAVNELIVAGAWDFDAINGLYLNHRSVLQARPAIERTQAGAEALREWAARERAAWFTAIRADPLLPKGYLGQESWKLRVKTLQAVAAQMRSFHPSLF